MSDDNLDKLAEALKRLESELQAAIDQVQAELRRLRPVSDAMEDHEDEYGNANC